MKPTTKVIYGIAVVLGLLVAPSVWAVRFHDGQLSRMQAQVAVAPHPRGSTLVARRCGLATWGSGILFRYWTFELRSLSGSPATLDKAYRGLRVRVPSSGLYPNPGVTNGTQAVDIEVLPSPLPRNYFIPIGMTTGCRLGKFAGRRNLYLVKVVSSGDSNSLAARLDWWRCEIV